MNQRGRTCLEAVGVDVLRGNNRNSLGVAAAPLHIKTPESPSNFHIGSATSQTDGSRWRCKENMCHPTRAAVCRATDTTGINVHS